MNKTRKRGYHYELLVETTNFSHRKPPISHPESRMGNEPATVGSSIHTPRSVRNYKDSFRITTTKLDIEAEAEVLYQFLLWHELTSPVCC
jgi:hypothetical protein